MYLSVLPTVFKDLNITDVFSFSLNEDTRNAFFPDKDAFTEDILGFQEILSEHVIACCFNAVII